MSGSGVDMDVGPFRGQVAKPCYDAGAETTKARQAPHFGLVALPVGVLPAPEQCQGLTVKRRGSLTKTSMR